MQQQNTNEQQVQALKARLFDTNEQVTQMQAMLEAVAKRVGFTGTNFNELLELIPEAEAETETEDKE